MNTTSGGRIAQRTKDLNQGLSFFAGLVTLLDSRIKPLAGTAKTWPELTTSDNFLFSAHEGRLFHYHTFGTYDGYDQWSVDAVAVRLPKYRGSYARNGSDGYINFDGYSVGSGEPANVGTRKNPVYGIHSYHAPDPVKLTESITGVRWTEFYPAHYSDFLDNGTRFLDAAVKELKIQTRWYKDAPTYDSEGDYVTHIRKAYTPEFHRYVK